MLNMEQEVDKFIRSSEAVSVDQVGIHPPIQKDVEGGIKVSSEAVQQDRWGSAGSNWTAERGVGGMK